MESLDERAERLKEAQDKALKQKFGPDGLIGTPEVESGPPEISKPVMPLEDSCYDALIYLREGMRREEVIEIILMRNRVTRKDAETIVDQTIAMKGTDDNSRNSGDDTISED